MDFLTPKPSGRRQRLVPETSERIPETSERIETLRDALVMMGCEPSGPVYQGKKSDCDQGGGLRLRY